jgi:hypothetical protein
MANNKIILHKGMDNSRVIRPKVEGIKDILSRGMSNNIIIPSRDTLNMAIPNKVMHNKDTGSNRVMDNHLPGKTCRPKKLRP